MFILLFVYSSARKNPLAKAVHTFLVENPCLWLLSCPIVIAVTQQQPKPEEVLGMIQGLASAMQTSFDAQKATTKQVTEIANSLKDLAEAQSKPSVSQGLRLLPVHLPTFKGDLQDNLSRFLEHFKSIISTSAISPRFYVANLKQQCESDVRAFDIICKAEQDHFKAYIPDPEKASDAEYLTYF